ncbi:Tat pathway signal sequence domain-containing protein [Arthrobacter nitrophenolicus]|uniref:Tat pathway signal sequence domain-containing protein n=1 Tax=Arthrobacter nitrophenolicus TaxID=683150 RepID=L8TPK0_9MICC|nr:Tat pathway signal sequence domain-containing protein [Arthrobacter nitrophenolicus]
MDPDKQDPNRPDPERRPSGGAEPGGDSPKPPPWQVPKPELRPELLNEPVTPVDPFARDRERQLDEAAARKKRSQRRTVVVGLGVTALLAGTITAVVASNQDEPEYARCASTTKPASAWRTATATALPGGPAGSTPGTSFPAEPMCRPWGRTGPPPPTTPGRCPAARRPPPGTAPRAAPSAAAASVPAPRAERAVAAARFRGAK